jgi:hypothetical protein
MPGIPTYGADGVRRRNHSLETVLYLESRRAVVLQRTRKGEVVSARFYGESSTGIRTRLKAGTRYSYLEQIGGHRGWAHSRLPKILSPAPRDCSTPKWPPNSITSADSRFALFK